MRDVIGVVAEFMVSVAGVEAWQCVQSKSMPVGCLLPYRYHHNSFRNVEGQRVYSSNLVGFSSDQCAASMNIKDWEGWLGNARYDVCALWGLLKGRLVSIKLTIDGKLVAPATSTFWITHTQHFGRGMRGSCEAYWDDGVFDCSAPEQLSAARLIQIFNGVKGGGWNKHVTPYFRGREAIFEFPTDEGLVNIDGETVRYEGGQVKVECVRNVVRFFAPQC
jgi:diacylglycerol kinase family enzyme